LEKEKQEEDERIPPKISFALGSGTLYRLPGVVNGCLSVKQMFETPGLAKIDADFPNAAASGYF